MDPNATLATIRSIIEGYRTNADEGEWDDSDTQELIFHVENLDAWMTRSGFLPDEWAPAADPHPPRIEIIHGRDSDGGCDIDVFTNGHRAGGVEIATIDPGWGYEFRDYAESLATMIVNSTPAVADILYENALYALDDKYVSDTPNDERVTQRYLDWLIFCERQRVDA